MCFAVYLKCVYKESCTAAHKLCIHSSILSVNSMDNRAWQGTVHGVGKNQTWLSTQTYSWKKWLFLTSKFPKFQVGLTEHFLLNLKFFPGEVAKISSLSSNSLPVLDLNTVLRNLRVRKKHCAFALNRLGKASVNIMKCQWLYGRHIYSLSPYKSCLGQQDLQAGLSGIYMAPEPRAIVSFLTAVGEEAS